LDIGANCGIYSLLACALNPRTTVTAWEPVPLLRERLGINVGLNGFSSRVDIRAAAVGATPHTATFHLHEDYTMGSLVERPHHRGALEVQVERVDDIVTQAVDLVKIDVEGAEPEGFAGMQRILAQDRPAIIFEAFNAHALDRCKEHLPGYDVRQIDSINYLARPA
jgi:FkbM family methyltransferase